MFRHPGARAAGALAFSAILAILTGLALEGVNVAGQRWIFLTALGTILVLGITIAFRLGSARPGDEPAIPQQRARPHPDFVTREYGELRTPVYRRLDQALDAIDEAGSWLVVDDCVRLTRIRPEVTFPQDVRVRILAEPDVAVDGGVTADLVGRMAAEASLAPAAADYLHARPLPDQLQRYFPKVSLRRIHFDNDHVPGSTMTLDVCPNSYWVEQELNRRFVAARETDTELDVIFQHNLALTLGAGRQPDGYEIAGPNTLYAEVAIVTSDGAMMLAAKPEDSGSTYAKVGRAWTCGVERSLNWDQLLPDGGGIDPRQIVVQAVNNELGLPAESVGTIEWCAIALEGHLNTALLGIAHLRRTRLSLAGHSFPRMEQVEWVRLDDLPERVFAEHRDGVWHTSARMRALHLLYRAHSTESEVNRLLRELRATGHPPPARSTED